MAIQLATHYGFSDESSWNQGRYRSIAIVTGELDSLQAMHRELNDVLDGQEIQEFKWKDLKDSKRIRASFQMLKIVSNYASKRKCRVDTLVWDVNDSRHVVQHRDDLQNLERMYYHLFKNVLQKRWPSNSTWTIAADEHDQIAWRNLEHFLTAVSTKSLHPHQKSFPDAHGSRRNNGFNIERIQPVQSQRYRLIQLADFFAGVSVFSWNHHEDYRLWQDEQSGQLQLFGEAECTASMTSKARFRVLHELVNVCRQNKFGLSNEPGGLQTPAYNAKNPITFWFYRPQSGHDKAPVKDKVRDKFGR